MDHKTRATLEKEVGLAHVKGEVYQNHIKPFIEKQEKVLFEAFKDVDANDTKMLQTIKLQQTALRSLEAEFVSYINSGILASEQLEKEQ